MTTRSLTLVIRLLGGLMFVVGTESPGWAQATNYRGWEVEGHVGGGFGGSGSDGSSSLPPAGATFITSSGRPSRAVSSWYFGDGATLLNQIIAGFSSGVPLPRIAPLDPVLAKAGVTRRSGVDFGFRVGRSITPRFAAEFNLDAAQGQLTLTDEMLAGVEASRSSFTSAFNGLISTGGGVVFTNPNVTSIATIQDEGGRQIFTTGALTINVTTLGRFTPYATIGAGMVTNVGDLPRVSLVGNYQLRIFGLFPVNETDAVTIRAATEQHAFVTVLGGGVRMLGSGRWGVRGDVRAYLSRNSVDLLVDANPNVVTQTPAGFISSTTTPSMQFSNNPLTGERSSLSGPAIEGLPAFSGRGTQVHVTASVGYFVRF
jgi:hypothetical protein